MATTGIKHRFTNGHSDEADSTIVNASNWNDTHTTDAKILALDTDPSLSASRTLTPRDGMRGVDGGAGSTYTLDHIPDRGRIILEDDFMPTLLNSSIIGQLNWAARNDFNAGFSLSNIAGIANHPGILRLTASGAAVSGDGVEVDLGGNSFNGMAGLLALSNLAEWDAYFVVRLGTTSNIRFRCGFGGAMSGGSPADFIGIRYDTSLSDTGWKGEARASGTPTTTSNLATADTSFHTFRIRCTSAGTILFSIDGGTELSLASGLPASSVAFVPQFVAVATASNPSFTLDIDYFSFFLRGLSR
jgi:hypothetical protein